MIDLSVFGRGGSIEGCSCIDLLHLGHHWGFCRGTEMQESLDQSVSKLTAILLYCFRADNVFWSSCVGTSTLQFNVI